MRFAVKIFPERKLGLFLTELFPSVIIVLKLNRKICLITDQRSLQSTELS